MYQSKNIWPHVLQRSVIWSSQLKKIESSEQKIESLCAQFESENEPMETKSDESYVLCVCF